MSDVREGVRVVRAADAPALDVLGSELSVLSDERDVRAFVGEHVVPPGYGVPLHVHDVDDELFYILEGALTVGGRDGETTVHPGACVHLPHGIPHTFRNDTQASARFLVVLIPGLRALAMFQHLASLAGGAEKPAPPEIAAITAQYGVHLV